MKTILILLFAIVSISVYSQDTTKVKVDYKLVSDTAGVKIPDKLFEELKQIEMTIPMLEKRKREILEDVLTFNDGKIIGRKFKSMNGQRMIFERIDTVRVKPEVKKKIK